MFVSFLRPGLFLSLLVLVLAGLGVVLAAAGQTARADREAHRVTGAYTVRVLTPADDKVMTKAATALAAAPGVASAQPMDAARAAQLLTRWGGQPIDEAALPPLHLIEVRAVAAADPVRVAAALADALRVAGVSAEIYDAGPARSGQAPAVRIGTFGGVGAALAAFLAVLFVASGAAAADRARAVLFADHGASRGEALAAFGRAGAEIAFLAGAGALILAFVTAPGVRLLAGETISYSAMIAGLSSWDVLLALAAPLAAGLAGLIGARLGASRAFDSADRLG